MGGNLLDHITKLRKLNKTLTENEVKGLAAEMIMSLHDFHKLGMFHTDLHAENY